MDRNLRAFLAVARASNITAAANEIGLTQPALSKTVRRLEAEFGAALFERSTRGMELTDLGQALLKRALLIEMHYRQAHEEAAAIKSGKLTQFTVRSGQTFHMLYAPSLVSQLIREFPETRFSLAFDVEGTTLPELVNGDIDLSLGALHTQVPDGIETREILRVEMVAYCCRTNPLASRRDIEPDEIEHKRWVVYRRDSALSRQLAEYCARFRLMAPQVVLEIDSLLSSFAMVRGTEFLTLAPSILQGVAAGAGLSQVDLKHGFWNFASGASFRHSSYRFPVMRRALELLPQIVAATGAAEKPFPNGMEIRS